MERRARNRDARASAGEGREREGGASGWMRDLAGGVRGERWGWGRTMVIAAPSMKTRF